MQLVEDAFIERFGDYAGWAHNTLFISELASHQERLPAHLQRKGTSSTVNVKKTVQTKRKDKQTRVPAEVVVATEIVATVDVQ